MPKMKSHKGLLKRVRITGRGKVKHKRQNTSHLMSSFSGDRARRLRRPKTASTHAVKKMERQLGIRLIGREQA